MKEILLLALKKLPCCDKVPWLASETTSRSREQPSQLMASKKTGSQTYSHKELDSSNSLMGLEEDLEPQKKTQLDPHLISILWD